MSSRRILRLLPAWLRGSIYSRFLRGREVDPADFADVSLAFAPGVRMELSAGDGFHRYLAATGFYELDLTRRILAQAGAGGWMLDVGANYGYFSLLWAAARRENRVIAFEPEPANCAALRRNVARNGLGDRVEIRESAAGDRTGTAAFFSNSEAETGWASLAPSHGRAVEAIPELSVPPKGEGRRITVPTVRLDECIGGDAKVTVLKIDVEGAECLVLAGAERLFRERRVGCVFFENIPEQAAQMGFEPLGSVRMLEQWGYSCRPIDAQEWNWVGEVGGVDVRRET